jgi:hypothetical protein
MNSEQEKNMVSDTGYEVKQNIHIGDKAVLYAEDMNNENGMYYLVSYYSENGIFCSYENAVVFDDYLEAMQAFTERVSEQIEKVRNEIAEINLPADIFTAEHCVPHSYSQDIVGKIVAMKAGIFRREYRRGDNQLVLVESGNGARANARGNAVYCYKLNTGEFTRFERYDVLGEVKPECIPDWAKRGVEKILAQKEKGREKHHTPETVNGYTITKAVTAGNTTFALAHDPEAVNPYVTWKKRNDSPEYFWGNYFNDEKSALEDLDKRVEREKESVIGKSKTREEKDER